MSTNNSDYDYLFKYVVVGDARSGKTSFLRRLRIDDDGDLRGGPNDHDPAYLATIGVDCQIHRVFINNRIVKVQIMLISVLKFETGSSLNNYFNRDASTARCH
jgi:GTPase SAR1 family protein